MISEISVSSMCMWSVLDPAAKCIFCCGFISKSWKATGLRGCSHIEKEHEETYQGTGIYSVFSFVHLNNIRKYNTRQEVPSQTRQKKDYLESA